MPYTLSGSLYIFTDLLILLSCGSNWVKIVNSCFLTFMAIKKEFDTQRIWNKWRFLSIKCKNFKNSKTRLGTKRQGRKLWIQIRQLFDKKVLLVLWIWIRICTLPCRSGSDTWSDQIKKSVNVLQIYTLSGQIQCWLLTC